MDVETVKNAFSELALVQTKTQFEEQVGRIYIDSAVDYQVQAARTINRKLSYRERLDNFALGLAGESGEVCEPIKKALYHNKTLDPQALMYELGDVLWYVAGICTTANVSLDLVLGITSPSSPFDSFADFQHNSWLMLRRHTLSHYALRVADYAGRVAKHVNEVISYDFTLDGNHLIMSLNRLLLNLSCVASLSGLKLDLIASANIQKLWLRHPQKFSPDYADAQTELFEAAK